MSEAWATRELATPPTHMNKKPASFLPGSSGGSPPNASRTRARGGGQECLKMCGKPAKNCTPAPLGHYCYTTKAAIALRSCSRGTRDQNGDPHRSRPPPSPLHQAAFPRIKTFPSDTMTVGMEQKGWQSGLQPVLRIPPAIPFIVITSASFSCCSSISLLNLPLRRRCRI